MKNLINFLGILIPKIFVTSVFLIPKNFATNVYDQVNAIDFRKDWNFNLNFNSALKTQFPDLVANSQQIALISKMLDMVLISEIQDMVKSVLETESDFFAVFEPLENAQIAPRTLLSLFSFLGSVVRSRLGPSHSLLASSCKLSSRYSSSFLVSWEFQKSDWEDPASVFPVSPRIRDLSITRNKCVEDSLISVLSLNRNLTNSDIAALRQIAFAKLLSGNWPFVDLIISKMDAQKTPTRFVPVFAKMSRTHASRKYVASAPPIWGFDCGGESQCVVESLIENLDARREISRSERLFLQSINANWEPILSAGWGLRISSALADRARYEKEHFGVCPDDCVVGFDDPENSDEKRKLGLHLLMHASPECTVAIAASYVLIHEAFLSPLLRSDLANLLELAWQTIAGERMETLFRNQIHIFDIMTSMWSKHASSLYT